LRALFIQSCTLAYREVHTHGSATIDKQSTKQLSMC